MARNLIASKLIKSVRDRAMIPDDISVYDDEAILNILNEVMDVSILTTLLDIHEEHLVVPIKISPYTKGASGYRYVIPHRAVGNKFRDLFYVNGTEFYELSRVDLGEMGDYNNTAYNNNVLGRNLFFVEGDEIVTLGPSYSGQLEITAYMYLRPSIIVEEAKCAKITGINRETGIIQFSSIPRNMVGMLSADCVQNKTPNKILGVDIPVKNVNINTRTMEVDPKDIPVRLSEGDWFCEVETSPYPNIPTELHPVLAQRAGVQILEAMGDEQNLARATATLKTMEMSVQKLLDNRVEGAPQTIKNRYSTLNSSSTYSRRRRRF